MRVRRRDRGVRRAQRGKQRRDETSHDSFEEGQGWLERSDHPPSVPDPPLHTLPLNHPDTGIVSSIAFCPDQTNEYFAAGTLTPSNFNIALFSESTGEKTITWVGCEELRNSVSQVCSTLPARTHADPFSTSQLRFHPTNPSILYASFRRSARIYSWDLRGDTSIPLQAFQTSDFGPGELSNQKLTFDIDYAGKWLGVGDNVCPGLLRT